jgi:ATP-binding cassette subfamily B protein
MKLLNECGVGVAGTIWCQQKKRSMGWLALSLGAAMVSRIAKTFKIIYKHYHPKTGTPHVHDGIQSTHFCTETNVVKPWEKTSKIKTDCEGYPP